MSAAGSFDALCSKLAAQHLQFLSEAHQEVFEALRRENQRLSEENLLLRRSSVRGPPPLPPLPDKLETPPGTRTAGDDGKVSSAGHHSSLRAASGDRPPQLMRLASIANRLQLMDVRSIDVTLPGEVPPSPAKACVVASSGKRALPRRPSMIRAASEVRRRRRTETKRLRQLLDVGAQEDEVSADALVRALKTREPGFQLSRNRVDVVIGELNRVAGRPPRQGQISFEVFLDLMNNDSITDKVHEACLKDVSLVMAALRNPTVEEIVDAVSHSMADGEQKEDPKSNVWQRRLNALVMTVVGVNMLAMALSVDHSPSHVGWLILEAFCVSVFLAELVIKILHFGAREFFRGKGAVWNTTDFFVTAIALVELSLSLAQMLFANGMGEGWMIASAMRVAVMLRALRFVRVIRLIRLVDSPLLRDLANMLVGFLIGIPSLMWVLAFFFMVLFLVGLFFRMIFGPSEGQDLIYEEGCGLPDDWSTYTDTTCRVSWMYGEEFFGTTWKSMFTLFRFMLGDYSTRGGKSLSIAFSQDYGAKFDILFTVWMIVVIFGLFNIITSIFVETTVAGLKHNDVKRKYAMQYQKRFVQAKLTEMLNRIRVMHLEQEFLPSEDLSLDFYTKASKGFTEEEYMRIMEDDKIKQLLQDLDIDVMPLSGLFGTFDCDESGSLSLQELVEGIVKLRGEPQKSDTIGCWVATRHLHKKVDQVLASIEQDKGGFGHHLH